MVTLIFRSRGSGGFSVERLFESLVASFEAHGLPVARLELPHISSSLRNVLRNAWFVARHRRSALLHVVGDVHYAALFCPFAKTVITIHDCVVLERGAGFKRLVLWLLWFRLPLTFVSAVTVTSEKTRRDLMRTVSLPPRKVTLIPNFVGSEFGFVPKVFDEACPRILHVGTKPNKNLLRVIGALAGIRCVLVVVGVLTQSACELLRRGGVAYESHVNVESSVIVKLYETCDLVSFPSTYEGFGLPILEGQTVGRPVLTSDAEPMLSVAGRGGALFVDPLSEESIRNGFRSLIADSALRTRLVEVGRANCARYSMEAVAASYEALYRGLLEK